MSATTDSTAEAAPVAPPADRGSRELAGALGMVLAGAGHVFAALDHLSHALLFSAFFLVVAVAQLLLAARIREGARPALVMAVLAGSIGLVLLYVVSRTVALEFGPHSDRPEDPDVLGTAVLICELVTIAVLPTLLPPRWRGAAVNMILAVGVAVWVAWFTGLIG